MSIDVGGSIVDLDVFFEVNVPTLACCDEWT